MLQFLVQDLHFSISISIVWNCRNCSSVVFILSGLNEIFSKTEFPSWGNDRLQKQDSYMNGFCFLSGCSFTDAEYPQDSRNTHSRTLRHLFGTFHVRWIPCIYHIVCNYQTATWWYLSPWDIINIWLIGLLIIEF